jgi:two-component system, OmpR family, phosphate regulon sensor histidine kinase PhoR
MLVNLVDNAVKATENGTVVVSIRGDSRDLVIEIEDTGIGIDESDIPHLFERFYVVDKSRSRKQGGTGLGLSIVKHIVMAHQGKISVKSQIGKGTVFTILLPAAA